ncbi:hypothetical protein RB600_004197 [Gaeumannomyces tritici]
MSRWHRAGCSEPNIHLEGNVPHCRACGACPQLDEMAAAANKESPLLSVPPDEPLHDMNLLWPPSVPYRRPKLRQDNGGPKADMETRSLPTQEEKPRAEIKVPVPTAAIYDPPLGLEQFRLLCLHPPSDGASDGPVSPIHCDLEVYPLSDSPWYEAVSYAWGGEKGENAKTCPVYVGPYWDVVLQTQNCHDMLLHMRPRRGLRLLWVDALCINQQDVAERNRQVARMSDIYAQCTSVLVYLGPDECSPEHLEGRSNPHRAALAPIKIKEWLDRRYFSRVWIIQELVLPGQVVVRSGGVEFFAHGSQLEGFAELCIMQGTWETTPAQWVQHVAKGSLSMVDMLGVIRLTWKSDASDPRDRIFGILGLLEDGRQEIYHHGQPTKRYTLAPDYSLSPQHVFTGFFAHVVAACGKSQALCAAVGITGWGRMPSWIPDWQAPVDSRPRLFSEIERRAYAKWDSTLAIHQDAGIIPSGRDLSILTSLLDLFPQPFKDQLGSHTIIELRTCNAKDIVAEEASLASRKGEHAEVPDDYLIDSHVPWNEKIWVDSRTGGLNLKLVHLMPVPSSPLFLDRDPKRHTHRSQYNKLPEYGLAGEKVGVILTSMRKDLAAIVDPQLDHIFVAIHSDGTYTPFVLRPVDPKRQPSMYSIKRNGCLEWGDWQVVAACGRMFLVGDATLDTPCSVTLDEQYWASATYGVDGTERFHNTEAYFSSRRQGFLPGEPRVGGQQESPSPGDPPRFCISYFQQLRWRLSLALQRAVKAVREAVAECQDPWCRPPSHVPEAALLAAQLLGPKGYTVENVVCLFQAVLDEERSGQRGLVERELLQKADPRLEFFVDKDGMMQLTAWLPALNGEGASTRGPSEAWGAAWAVHQPLMGAPILKAPLKDVLDRLRQSRLYYAVKILNKSTHGSALQALADGPSPMDRHKACPDFSEETVTDLQLDGTTYAVCLV